MLTRISKANAMIGGAIGASLALPVVSYSAIASATIKAIKHDAQVRSLATLAIGSVVVLGGSFALFSIALGILLPIENLRPLVHSKIRRFFNRADSGTLAAIGALNGGIIGGLSSLPIIAYSVLFSATAKAINRSVHTKPIVILSVGSVVGLTLACATIGAAVVLGVSTYLSNPSVSERFSYTRMG